MIKINCKFCSSAETKSSNDQRKVSYDNKIFEFKKCLKCKSYFLIPTLTDSQLERLYSTEYIEENDKALEGEENDDRFLDITTFLKTLNHVSTSKFLDYGCGVDSKPIKTAMTRGFECYGMEYEAEIRSIAHKKSGVPILSKDEFLDSEMTFDLIFIGDVLEHLVDPAVDLANIVRKLNLDGIVYIQGPLQGSQTFLHTFVKLLANFTKNRTSSYPPYHVNLFSLDGMTYLTDACGLEIKFVKVTEVDWPALSAKQLWSSFTFRALVLFGLKCMDKFLCKILKNYGTRVNMVCALRKLESLPQMNK